MTMNEYISKATYLLNTLSTIGDNITIHEQILYLLCGQNFDYNSLATKLTYKKENASYKRSAYDNEIHEQQLESMYTIDPQSYQANYMKVGIINNNLLVIHDNLFNQLALVLFLICLAFQK